MWTTTAETEMTSSLLTLAVFAVVASAVVGHDGGWSAGHWYKPVSKRGRIYLAGLFPLTSRRDDNVHGDRPAPDVLEAVLMALDDVNRNRHILPNHDLLLVYNDTEVRDSAPL